MHRTEKIAYIPKTIERYGSYLVNVYSNEKIFLNEMSIYILDNIQKVSVHKIIDELSIKYNIDEEEIKRDVNNILDILTKKKFIAWKFKSRNIVSNFIVNEIYKLNKTYFEQYLLGEKINLRTFFILIRAILNRMGFMSLLIFIFLFISDILLGKNHTIYALFTTMGLIISTAIHEYIHAFTFFKITGEKVFFEVSRFHFSSVRRKINNNKTEVLIKFLAPFITGLIGVIGVILSYRILNKHLASIFSTFFAMFFISILDLLPFKGDGKFIFTNIMKGITNHEKFKKNT